MGTIFNVQKVRVEERSCVRENDRTRTLARTQVNTRVDVVLGYSCGVPVAVKLSKTFKFVPSINCESAGMEISLRVRTSVFVRVDTIGTIFSHQKVLA